MPQLRLFMSHAPHHETLSRCAAWFFRFASRSPPVEVQHLASSVEHALGRVYLIRCDGPLGGPIPESAAAAAVQAGARVVLVDATSSPYGDSDGLRWLLRLQTAAESQHRVAEFFASTC